jgi:hypothetical protein
LVLLLGLAYSNFFAGLPRQTRLLFIVSGVVYLSGALVLEFVGHLIASAYDTKRTMAFAATATMAELLEMFGIIFFIYILITFLNTQLKEPSKV